ncbi:isopentenyl diphosphate isomerase/L-lactate dehydrogenase-like FMN-dependent dehydrogenase [Rhizobium sp. BK538]|nr:isopentenyl diphosphate isomerase/L-lactate dehydrogenase-like FMN-dependent dehydrogenase [Rhizobium sp. BK060]MBB4170703.1 isopentenyl diphosphate isomerase/L-lactate dehydrogenase-like FMN-dependent dehydrogenase [Rhizobium sp. BK538]
MGLRQHVLVDYAEPDLSTEYLGRRHPLPFMLGPVGLLGRAYAYALAAAGQARVDRAIETLRRVFSITSALMGVSSIADLKKRGSHLILKQ